MRGVGFLALTTVCAFILSAAGIRAQTVSGSLVKDAVASYIRQSTPESVETAIRFKDLKTSYPVGYKQVRLTVTSANSVAMKGLVTFLVKARAAHKESGFTQIIPVTVEIRTFQDVLVTTKTIQPRTEIGPDEVSAVRTETTNMMNPVSRLSQLKGKCTSRWIQSGKALTFDMFQPVPLVKYGDNITIVVRSKNIVVSDQGSAIQDGTLNQIIRVVNEYKDNLRGKVIGKDEVLLVN